MVIWRDGDQQWRCFEDKCPHRWLTILVQARGSLSSWLLLWEKALCISTQSVLIET